MNNPPEPWIHHYTATTHSRSLNPEYCKWIAAKSAEESRTQKRISARLRKEEAVLTAFRNFALSKSR